jgi:hypothetical protein
MLARYGEDVLVLESHDTPGGAAHSFEIKGYHFDSGPSLFSGLSSRGPQANPLAQVLDALGEAVDHVQYDSWMVHIPEGQFLSRIGPTEFYKVSSGNNNQSNHPLQPFLSICLYRQLSFTECHSLNREQSMTIYYIPVSFLCTRRRKA